MCQAVDYNSCIPRLHLRLIQNQGMENGVVYNSHSNFSPKPHKRKVRDEVGVLSWESHTRNERLALLFVGVP